MKYLTSSMFLCCFLFVTAHINAQQADQCIEFTQIIELDNCQYDFEGSEGFDFHDEAFFDFIRQDLKKAKRNSVINYMRDAGTATMNDGQTISIFDVHNFFLKDNRLERIQVKRLSAEIEDDQAIIEYQISFIVDGRVGENCARLRNKFEKKYRVFQHESIINDNILPYLQGFMEKAKVKTERYMRCN